jgi:hypothetical protein
MIRTLALAAILGAVAVPAFAGTQVTVNVGGLSDAQAHRAIEQAAQTACRAELADETQLVQYYARPDCLQAAIATAEAKYNSMRRLASR